MAKDIKHLDKMAIVLDSKFRGPFGFRFGWDGLLGLIPGLGDIITNLMATYIIMQATWKGYPTSIITRMFLNLVADNAIDAIPIVGNIFDFFFKSNLRNIRLLQEYQVNPTQTERRSHYTNILIITLMLAFLGGMIFLSVLVLYKLIEWVLNYF